MSRVLLTLLSLVVCLNRRVTQARMIWTYQNDLSEQCRRRVMPSVFLGEQVIESNSQMLHFGPLELPYSCFITVRTEAGNNIILVISLSSEEALKSSCRAHRDQLLVFEMGETYGGYWGPLSNRLLFGKEKETEDKKTTKKVYTLATTQKAEIKKLRSTFKRKKEEEEEEIEFEAEELTTTPRKRTTEEDSFVIEVPIVNVAVHEEPADKVLYQSSKDDFDEAFDLLHDVMPRPDENYSSTIIPIVQLSVEKGSGIAEDQPRYQLNYNFNQGDPSRRRYNKIKTIRERFFEAATHPFQRNKLLKFKATPAHKRTKQSKRPRYPTYSYRYTSNKRPLVRAHKPKPSLQNKYQDIEPQLTSNDRSTETAETTVRTHPDSWQHVVNLMNNMKAMTDDGQEVELEDNDTISDVKEKVSDMKHNMSIYLEPDFDLYVQDGKSERHFSEQSVATKFNISMFTRTPLKLGSTNVPFSTYLKPKSSTPKVTQILKETVKTIKKDGNELGDKTNNTKNIISTTNEGLLFSERHGDLINTTIYVSQSKTENSSEEDNKYSSSNVEIKYTSDPRQEMSGGQKNLMEKLNQIHYNNDFLQTTTSLEVNKPMTNFATSREIVEPVSGTTVDHESWENVVQAAPRIAEVLNQTATQEDDSLKSVRKRSMESIPIVNAKPHSRTTTKTIDIPTNHKHNDTDAITFSSLIEPVDDEMHGRIDLRHILKFVGPVYFNICDNQEAKDRQVKLFNSSKIVLALVNFTLDQMTLVTTTAHQLSSSNMQCPISHLECQIEGKRVCIDSNCACDNVPNCGSYEIYDEDRLFCGGDNSHEHYVYLAGFTFITVILTTLYTVLYWLKRCVPRVSEAFFVYTAGTENVLYLDSVMRSPTDFDNASKLVYNGDFLEDDLMLDEKKDRSFYRKILGLCAALRLWRKKRGSSAENIARENNELRKMYSFAELELKKMSQGQNLWDKGVQTGESLEMTQMYGESAKKRIMDHPEQAQKPHAENVKDGESSPDFGEIMNVMNITHQKHESDDLKELKILKVLRDARVSTSPSDSTQSQTIDSRQSSRIEETEMHTTDYDKPFIEVQSAEKTKPSNMTRTPQNIQSKKRLRFQKEATAIPSTSAFDDEDEDDDAMMNRRQSVMLGPTKARRGLMGLGKNEEDSGQGLANTALDFSRFWSKKTGNKKKQNVSKRK